MITSVYSKRDAKLKDKYYTRPDIAALCWSLAKPHLPSDALIIEPSAGGGAFFRVVEGERDIKGFDIAPDQGGHPKIAQHDSLGRRDIRDLLSTEDRQRSLVCLGNPLFGHRSETAIAFLDRALSVGEVVGFVVPVSFRKWGVQPRITASARLIADYDLPDDAFTLSGEPYSIRCCFQIWSMIDPGHPDLRIRVKPSRLLVRAIQSDGGFREGLRSCLGLCG